MRRAVCHGAWLLAGGLATSLAGAVPADTPAADASDAGTSKAVVAAPRVDNPAAPAPRPRIGLVLGGGGAKGAAHVGVLQVLEEMRVPIDCVVGTSMGALVGGTYASGQTAADVEQSIRSISWSDTIAFRGYRERLPMRRKLAGVTYSNDIEFGIGRNGLSAPHGFINTQNIEQTIKHLVRRSLGETDFDRLPIPFRAVATDMQAGDMAVLSSGDLAQAMRASMAVPCFFSPSSFDGHVLGDGGLTRNLPVDIARQTCADVVIAVSVPNPPPTTEELQSPLTMMSRTVDVLIGANEKQQLATLRPEDVKIVVPMGVVGSASFDKVGAAIPLGRSSAEQQRAALARYSLPAEEYAAWRADHARPDRREVQLADITIVGLQRVNREYVLAHLGLQPGEVVDQAELARAMDGLFALDDFDSVQYAMHGDPSNPSLEVQVLEKAAGPNIVRFDLGLAMGTDGNTAFSLSADYLRPWIDSRGGEVHGHLQLGRFAAAALSLYQPLGVEQRWFVEPGAYADRSLEDIYDDGHPITRYEFQRLYGFLEGGRVFGTHSEFRLGVRSGMQAAKRDIASRQFEQIDPEGYGGVTAGYTFDDRDKEALATRGWLGRLRYYQSFEELGGDHDYRRLEGLLAHTVPVWNDLLMLRGMGGASFGSSLPLYDDFVLGGPVSFPGLSTGQLRGDSYWAASALYLHKIAEISEVFGQSLYLGMQVSAADMSGRVDHVRAEPVYSGAVVLGGRTPLGPLSLSLSATSDSDWQIVFGLGRPLEERNIADPSW